VFRLVFLLRFYANVAWFTFFEIRE